MSKFKVATVLTVYGIETITSFFYSTCEIAYRLQQYLPFTVLKLFITLTDFTSFQFVATVLTVYGIETGAQSGGAGSVSTPVATVLTVYGIETCCSHDNISFLYKCCNSTYRLRY